MATRTYTLLGDPVSHSASPHIYAAAFAELGIDASYRAHRVSPDAFAAAMMKAAEAGGGNVTVPHKRAAAGLLDEPDASVEATGACNCFWRVEERLIGSNTDVEGFEAAVAQLGVSLVDARVLLLGAGGAARAVLHAVGRRGGREVGILNRTAAHANQLAHESWDTGVRVVEDRDVRAGSWALVVNATPLGLSPRDPSPLALDSVDAGAVLDLAYAPGGTRWSRQARAFGLPAADGLEMLVQQAARALEHWLPGRRAPVETMRGAARRAMGDSSAPDGE